MLTERTMSQEQRVDGVVLEYLLQAMRDDQVRYPQRIVQDSGLPRLVVARSIQRLYGLQWIKWETIPLTWIAGWRLTELGAMAAADYPRPYYRDPDGYIRESRRCVGEVILTPSEFARLPEDG